MLLGFMAEEQREQNSRIKKVILDTNFLIYCARQKIDYETQISKLISEAFEFIVPEQVILELEDFKKNAKKGKDREAADLALKLLKHHKVLVVKSPRNFNNYADNAIIGMAKGNYVATMDNGLRDKVDNSIVIEGTKKLILD